jgi:GntR family transcriptional regulator
MSDLELRVQPGSPLPIWRQIVDGVAQASVAGRLAAGDAVPSVRDLAERLVVNPNTVAKAYAELVREGILAAQAGRGYVVAKRRPVFTAAERARRLDAAIDEVVGIAARLGIAPADAVRALARRLGIETDDRSKS